MKRLPRVSIVVFGAGTQLTQLQQALASIFEQSYPETEVIVVTEPSAHQSAGLFPEAQWHFIETVGKARALEEGLQHCTGQLVGWLMPSDYLNGDALWTLARAWQQFPDAGVYVGNSLQLQTTGAKVRPIQGLHAAVSRSAIWSGADVVPQPSTFYDRTAVAKAGGIAPDAEDCLDWELLGRVLERRSAVLIHEILACGSALPDGQSRRQYQQRVKRIGELVGARHARSQAVPVCPDESGDRSFLPLPRRADVHRPVRVPDRQLPTIRVVLPLLNHQPLIEQSLQSLLEQEYPALEIALVGDSEALAAARLPETQHRISRHVVRRRQRPATIINAGLTTTEAEVISWLVPKDLLSQDALLTVGEAFAADHGLDLVHGNAIYIDRDGEICTLSDSAVIGNCLLYGQVTAPHRRDFYWSTDQIMAQPTVFFRRRLLERLGPLSRKCRIVFDFEFFNRILGQVKIAKIERTQALFRVPLPYETYDFRQANAELYRIYRRHWPSRFSKAFWASLNDYLNGYWRRRFGVHPTGWTWWRVAGPVALAAITGILNPERWPRGLFGSVLAELPVPRSVDPRPIARQPAAAALPADLLPPLPEPPPTPVYHVETAGRRYCSIFFGFVYPRNPGHSGGEIRDFHLLRHLLTISKVEFFALYSQPPDERSHLGDYVDAIHTRESLFTTQRDTKQSVPAGTHQAAGEPIVRVPHWPNPRYQRCVYRQLKTVADYFSRPIQESLDRNHPDFLFVCPQLNPLACSLSTAGSDTRLILATYDVEAVKIERFARSAALGRRWAWRQEARRAAYFESHNLAYYDGIIAVSELDKDIFHRRYGYPQERILVIKNGVDPNYFAFSDRRHVQQPTLLYVGVMNYAPNRQAAWRLLRRIVPLARRRCPELRLWLVGAAPDQRLLAMNDGDRTLVTGRVVDVRPYLASASVFCAPLESGSGTKLKVVEALSSGVPVVATSLAVEGLDLRPGEHFLAAESDSELVSAVARILEDPESAAAMARRGREHVVDRYSWGRIVGELGEWLDFLKNEPRRGAALPESPVYYPPVESGETANKNVSQPRQAVQQLRDREMIQFKQRRATAVLTAIAEQGVETIAVFGAGQHTLDILPSLQAAPVRVCAILDDRRSGSINQWPIVPPEKASEYGAQAVVLSSDYFEHVLWEKRGLFLSQSLRVFRLYPEGLPD